MTRAPRAQTHCRKSTVATRVECPTWQRYIYMFTGSCYYRRCQIPPNASRDCLRTGARNVGQGRQTPETRILEDMHRIGLLLWMEEEGTVYGPVLLQKASNSPKARRDCLRTGARASRASVNSSVSRNVCSVSGPQFWCLAPQ